MKKLITAATILSILAAFIFVVVHSITGAATVPLTNEMAIDQLNGGDVAYVMSQSWYDFRNLVTYIGYVVSAAAITLIAIIIFKVSKERNK